VIETTISHSEFDDPGCCGCLNVVGRAGMFVEFVCNECGAVVACARVDDTEAAIHALELNCPVATAACDSVPAVEKVQSVREECGSHRWRGEAADAG